MKLYSALFDDFYPFKDMGLFSDYKVVKESQDYEDFGALVVWGGGDISPSLYNRAVGRRTGADLRLSMRDAFEWELMKGAQQRGMPIIGICRGAQMACALAGGFLIQDVTNHGRAHRAVTKEGRSFTVSSLHHQMLFPWDVPHDMVAWSDVPRSRHYLDVDTDRRDVPCEPEFVYFPTIKAVAIQWHPEYMEVDCPANVYVKEKIQELVL